MRKSAFRGSPSANPSQIHSSAQPPVAPQRDCGRARNQSAWRHEAQAARRLGLQCRRHPLRTRVGASRTIRAQCGSALSTSARETLSSRGAQRPDAQVLWQAPRPSRSRSPRQVPARGRESKEPRRTVGAIAIVKRSDCRGQLSTRPTAPVPDARRWALCTAHNIAAELTGTSLYWHIADGRTGRAGPFGWPVLSSSPARYMMMPDLALMRSPPLCNRFAFLMMGAILLSQSIETPAGT